MGNYLYNGVELPAPFEWDRAVYPYAVIVPSAVLSGCYRFYCFAEVGYHNHENGYMIEFIAPRKCYRTKSGDTGTNRDYVFDKSKGGIWDFYYEYGEGEKAESVQVTTPIWANFDILNEDGSVYLAASDPIPVYDPTALLQGYLVGCRIRAMRGKKQQWEVLFEGDVTTKEDVETGVIASENLSEYDMDDLPFDSGDTVRITVDGETTEHTASALFTTVYAGNPALILPGFAADDSYNFAVGLESTVVAQWYFYSRTPGTYSVKIEKKVV